MKPWPLLLALVACGGPPGTTYEAGRDAGPLCPGPYESADGCVPLDGGPEAEDAPDGQLEAASDAPALPSACCAACIQAREDCCLACSETDAGPSRCAQGDAGGGAIPYGYCDPQYTACSAACAGGCPSAAPACP